MNYDDWKSTEPAYICDDKPDPEPDCEHCGASPKEPCIWWCECRQCLRGQLRAEDREA